MHATTKCERALSNLVSPAIIDAEIRRHANRRPTDARGHLGAAPPGVRRADTDPPRGARSLQFACRLTWLRS